jgi:hypothetical protein
MERDLAHPALTKLKAWYGRTVPQEARTLTAEAVS